MWHEARKQERKIRGMLVDYRKRAERRQDFYERIKADPTQFMQIHSRKCKIHLDPAIAAAGDSPAIMMPWQGQPDNMIDRFDGRAYLDLDKIPLVAKIKETEEISPDERQCNYERYRILAQNDFIGISEEKYLHQLYLEEQFGINAQIEIEKPKRKTGGAAIGYTYEDSNDPTPFTQTIAQITSNTGNQDDDSDSDLDVDVAIDISKIDTAQAHELNACGRHYGMKSNDFYSFLTKDADEADALKLAREEEQEKIMLSGRKSRRERRAQRERRFAGRPISPPSYAAKEEPTFKGDEKNDSGDSRSPSPENSGKITYITSFGGEDELQPHSKISINFNKSQNQGHYDPSGSTKPNNNFGQAVSYADKVKQNLDKLKKMNNIRTSSESPKKPLAYQRRTYSRSRSRSRTKRSNTSFSRRRGRRSTSSRSRSRSRRDRRRTTSRSNSRRRKRRSRTRSRSRTRYSRSRSGIQRRRYTSSSSSSSVEKPITRKRSFTSSSSSTSSRSPSVSRPKLSSKSVSESPIRQQRSKSKSVPIPTTSLFQAIIKDEPKLPEPQVPIKKYYGRKRDDQSSSEDELNLNEDEPMDTTTSDRHATTVPSTQATSSSKPGKQLTTIDIKVSKNNSKKSWHLLLLVVIYCS